MENIINNDIFFDVLLCIDVFEHVEDYMGFLKSIKGKAIYKIFHIPLEINISSILRNSMMNSRNNAGHLHYFTPETALATLRDTGYEVIDYFFTKPFNDLPSKTLRNKLLKLPRKLLYAISPNLMIKLLGGCSLIVLAK